MSITQGHWHELSTLRSALHRIAAMRCQTGWGEPGLKNPPPCRCAICTARDALVGVGEPRPQRAEGSQTKAGE